MTQKHSDCFALLLSNLISAGFKDHLGFYRRSKQVVYKTKKAKFRLRPSVSHSQECFLIIVSVTASLSIAQNYF